MNPYRSPSPIEILPAKRWGATWLVRILTHWRRRERAQGRSALRAEIANRILTELVPREPAGFLAFHAHLENLGAATTVTRSTSYSASITVSRER